MDNTNNNSDIIKINGVDVPYNEHNKDNNVIYVDPSQAYKAAIEQTVRQNLNINVVTIEDAECVKNLYRIILTCGEYETPYVDENILEEYLKDEQKVISLIRKFPEVNKAHFNDSLPYLTFSLDDEPSLKRYIEILRKSFIKNYTPD
ncbi:hypothetical protein J6Z48_02435 [bacterium]|nr:hypothetical protein [bacterium]